MKSSMMYPDYFFWLCVIGHRGCYIRPTAVRQEGDDFHIEIIIIGSLNLDKQLDLFSYNAKSIL